MQAKVKRLTTSFVSVPQGGPPSLPGVNGVRAPFCPSSPGGCFLRAEKQTGHFTSDLLSLTQGGEIQIRQQNNNKKNKQLETFQFKHVIHCLFFLVYIAKESQHHNSFIFKTVN